MAENVSLGSLPDEILFHILSFLDHCDVIKISSTCKRMRELGRCDLIWKPICQKYWCISNCPSHLSWWDIFSEWSRDYGRYINVYRFIRRAWDEIEDKMDDNFPNIFESLQDGLSEEELDLIESQLNRPLPNDFRCVYRIHNGQRENMADMGLFGALQVYNVYSDMHMLDLRSLAKVYPSTVQKSCAGWQFTGCLPFSKCEHSGTMQYLALTDEKGHVPGQVFLPTQNVEILHSLNDEGNDQRKNFSFDDFILANSFMEYFLNFANNLDNYPNVNGQMFRFISNPKTKLKTGFVKVDVATCFCAEQSVINPPEFVYAYRITLSMDADAPADETCQLDSRHWIITDENGKEQRVDGPGVVGEFPIMRPDTKFSWISCTSFKTTYGTMGGHFTMRNLITGNTFDLHCPTFHLKCLPYQTAKDRDMVMQRVKKDQ